MVSTNIDLIVVGLMVINLVVLDIPINLVATMDVTLVTAKGIDLIINNFSRPIVNLNFVKGIIMGTTSSDIIVGIIKETLNLIDLTKDFNCLIRDTNNLDLDYERLDFLNFEGGLTFRYHEHR